MNKVKESLEQNVWLYRAVVMSLLGVLAFLGSWVFTTVTDIPKNYVTITASAAAHDELKDRMDVRDKGINDRLDRIEGKLDSLLGVKNGKVSPGRP